MLNISWEQYINDIEILINKLESIKMDSIKKIYGIPRGGVIPAIIISHYFDIPYSDIQNFDKDSKERCLIVDDLADTGTTFNNILKGAYLYNVVTAALYVKNNTKFIPDVFVKSHLAHDEWITFPYDKNLKSEDELIKEHEIKTNNNHPSSDIPKLLKGIKIQKFDMFRDSPSVNVNPNSVRVVMDFKKLDNPELFYLLHKLYKQHG